MENMTLSDIAAVTGGSSGFGGNGGIWLLVILFFLIGMGGNGFGRTGELGQYATAASQQEILFGQRFDALGQKINQIGDGICSSTYALNNSINGVQTNLGAAITTEGRNLEQALCATNAAIHAEGEQTRALIQQNKIESLQQKISALELSQAMCGVVRYPNTMSYNAGGSPFCGCNSCGNI